MNGEVLDDAAIVLHGDDTVATALDDLSAGRALEHGGREVTLAEDVPFGHKFALVAHDAGDTVRKYGEVIGRATSVVEPGEHVHTHNCESTRGRGDLAAGAEGSA